MIFVAVGTHPESFERLIKRIDEIAPQVKEKILIQRGFTKYIPKNCESFEFADSLEPYFKKARLVVSQSATSLLEFVLFNKKPLITVPRQKKFHEHLNDHQVEFAIYLQERTGIKAVLNIDELTPELLNSYKKVAKIDKRNFSKLQEYFKRLFNDIAKRS
ncbi:glycosyltransferase [Candidatus Pacearchaeota archaeon]|nr:glycosyltransferase [Candidatus Pacearchaeota archaeon]